MTENPDGLTTRVRQAWEGLARGPVFASGRMTVAVAPTSLTCPPGWIGFVVIGNAAIVTTPNNATAATVRQAMSGLPIDRLTNPVAVSSVMTVEEVLGPAYLAYTESITDPDRNIAVNTAGANEALGDLSTTTPRDELDEAGLDDPHSPLFVIRRNDLIVAAAGYRVWPGDVAHIGVVTAPAWRGHGFATTVGAFAARHALAAGLLPQWRARREESRRAARTIGFRERGSQLSIRLA